MKFQTMIAAAAALLSVAAVGEAKASQIVLSPGNVVGSSGYYQLCCNFNPGSILDQQTTTVTETFGSGYWLNPDNGPANAYITIDLGSAKSISSLELFETHNGNYGDRGTGDFTIIGGNSISGGQITGATVVLASGTLTATAVAPDGSPVTGETFASQSSGSYRYLEFLPTSVASINTPCCGTNVYGLDELKLFGGVPEPTTWALMTLGVGMLGFALRRRTATLSA